VNAIAKAADPDIHQDQIGTFQGRRAGWASATTRARWIFAARGTWTPRPVDPQRCQARNTWQIAQGSKMTGSDRGDQPARILVVEDERIVARDLAETLGTLGYRVIDVVATGEEAIDSARIHLPSAILMDIRLAGTLDGIETAARVHIERDVPVIYLTAHADEDTLRRATQTAPLGYLVKPFRSAELRCAIEIAIHRHEIDARLREREQWLARTLQAIGDGVVATDAQQKVTMLNPVAEALTGWKHDEALGHALDDIMSLVTERSGDAVANPVGHALHHKGITTLQGDAILVSRTGAAIPIADSAAPIMNDRGEVVGGVMVFRDASDERRLHEEIRSLNADLERRVVERTAQLEAANRELEAFSYSVAHDLRAPLRGIAGFSQVLIEDHASNLGPEGVGHLHRVRKAAGSMAQLIEDLLELSHVARAELQRQPVDLSQLARSVNAALQCAHPDRIIELAIQDGVAGDGDERLLQIVLENLFGNAWKFSSKIPGARIEFGLVKNAAAPVYFVRDNGAGFPMQYAHQLFGAFQRLHKASEFEGTGIGLALVQRIIHRHGGQIWGDSSAGQTTFYFTLDGRS
jgi:PAS domain S-box-containing protein